MRCAWGRSQRRTHRCRHRNLGRRRDGLAGRALAQRRSRRGRPGQSWAGPVSARTIRRSSSIGDTAALIEAKGHASTRRCARRKANGQVRREADLCSHRGPRVTPKPFHYVHLGDLATIGRRAAVVKFGRLELKGFLGWVFWSVAHIYFLIGLRNRFVVAFNWFWDYITFQRGARLITDVPRGEDPTRGA